MRCLVLGAGGFIGQNLVEELLLKGHHVVAYDRPTAILEIQEQFPQASYINGDFLTEENWENVLQGVNTCYHLISTSLPKTSNDDPISDVAGNVLGTLRLLEAARKMNRNIRIVFASSGGTVYGPLKSEKVSEDHPTDPICSYGITKLTIEKYLQLYRELHGVSSIALRIANPYGFRQSPDSTQGVIGVFSGRVLRNSAVDVWGDGSVIRDYIFVKDVVDAMLSAAHYGGREVVFNIGSGEGHSLREILNAIETATQKEANIIFHPSRGFDIHKSILNISRAKIEFNWSPKIGLQEGINKTIHWMKNYMNDSQKY
nr:NAD-dependent epimerase/dehydratase family protein [uncultured Albidiferax sp.]